MNKPYEYIKCARCKESKHYSEFNKNNKNATGFAYNCKPCKQEHERIYRRTPLGIITQMYGHQVESSKNRGHEKPSYTKKELKQYVLCHESFEALYNKYVDSGYDRMMIPSIDRLDSRKGYSMDNIQLVTLQVNMQNNIKDMTGVSLSSRTHEKNKKK